MSQNVTGPKPTPDPDPDRLQEIWHNASPAWRMQLPPYDPDAPALADPDSCDTEAG